MIVPRILAFIAGAATAAGVSIWLWRNDRPLAVWYWLLALAVLAVALVLP